MPHLVTVVIPAYGQSQFLGQTIDSALMQDNTAVFVVDDGSPDETPAVCAAYGGRIGYVRQENAGLCAARNHGIAGTSGEWLIFLDSDDLLPQDCVKRHLAAAEARPDADLFYGTFHCIDETGKPFGPGFDPVLPEEALHTMLMGTYFPPHAVMVRRAALQRVGLFDVALKSLEDWDQWIRLAAAGCRFVRTPGVSVPYRQHTSSMSRNYQRMHRCGLQVLAKNARHHGGHCAECRAALKQGHWGVRSAYWDHWGKDAARKLMGLAAETLCDPLLLAWPLRQRLRRTKHRVTGVNRAVVES